MGAAERILPIFSSPCADFFISPVLPTGLNLQIAKFFSVLERLHCVLSLVGRGTLPGVGTICRAGYFALMDDR